MFSLQRSEWLGAAGANAGVLAVANFGATKNAPDEIERVNLVRGFGDLAFELEPNEIAMVFHDPVRSPYGYHVVKRLR